jgi:SAM-dependent methyltransferase
VSQPVSKRTARTIFGRDPEAFDRARLRYPPRVFEVLTRRCGLQEGTSVFEIGPGTGIATRELLRLGAGPLTAIEPDPNLAEFLGSHLGRRRRRVRIVRLPFEKAPLEEAAYDLGVAATSFHWVEERVALRKIARSLRPGGWWAFWANLHGDQEHPSAFHRAIQPLYGKQGQGRPLHARPSPSLSVQQDRRARSLRATGSFDRITQEIIRTRVNLDTAHVTALWATFSDIAILPRKQRVEFLTGMARIVHEEFGGEAKFTVVTPLLTARRK